MAKKAPQSRSGSRQTSSRSTARKSTTPRSSRRTMEPEPEGLSSLFESEVPRADVSHPAPRRAGEGWVGRGQTAWRGYRGLRQRSRHNSMSWWGLKTVQGLLLGGGVMAIGLLIVLTQSISESSVWLSRLGLILIIVGAMITLRYMAAPFTCRWIVTVPENWYYVVEDGDGYTIEYLGPGRMIVPWRWYSRVVPYVDFNSVTINEVIEDVLDSGALPIDIEVMLTMSFDPTRADPELYAPLRKIRSQAQLEAMLAHDVRNIVRHHVDTLAPPQGQRGMLYSVQSLENTIIEQLANRTSMGLEPTATRPVTVHVRAPQNVKEAYQSVWARAARVREESQTLVDIKQLAQELNIPFEEAFQLFYIMQYGALPSKAAAKRATRTQDALPPVYVIRTPEHPPEKSPEPTPPPPTPEDIVDIVEVPPEEEVPLPPPSPTPPPAAPRVIDDPDRAPDPFDIRRQRKDRGRSRRE